MTTVAQVLTKAQKDIDRVIAKAYKDIDRALAKETKDASPKTSWKDDLSIIDKARVALLGKNGKNSRSYYCIDTGEVGTFHALAKKNEAYTFYQMEDGDSYIRVCGTDCELIESLGFPFDLDTTK